MQDKVNIFAITEFKKVESIYSYFFLTVWHLMGNFIVLNTYKILNTSCKIA